MVFSKILMKRIFLNSELSDFNWNYQGLFHIFQVILFENLNFNLHQLGTFLLMHKSKNAVGNEHILIRKEMHQLQFSYIGSYLVGNRNITPFTERGMPSKFNSKFPSFFFVQLLVMFITLFFNSTQHFIDWEHKLCEALFT